MLRRYVDETDEEFEKRNAQVNAGRDTSWARQRGREIFWLKGADGWGWVEAVWYGNKWVRVGDEINDEIC